MAWLPRLRGRGNRWKLVVLALLADLAVGVGVLLYFFATPGRAETRVEARADAPAEAPQPGLPAVLADLRRGGYVIDMRHGVTDPSHGGEDSDLAVAKVKPTDWAMVAVAAGLKP